MNRLAVGSVWQSMYLLGQNISIGFPVNIDLLLDTDKNGGN